MFRFALILGFLFSVAPGQAPSTESRREDHDIAKLAELTRADRSTIFFSSPDGCGYARNGEVRRLEFRNAKGAGSHRCSEVAASHEGHSIAYVTAGSDGQSQIVVRDLDTGKEAGLMALSSVPKLFCWSGDDAELLYLDGNDIVALSVAEGRKRTVVRLPIRVEGAAPIHSYHLKAVEQLHRGTGLVLSVQPWYPTGRRGEYTSRDQVLLWTPDQVRFLVTGAAAALAPRSDRIAYVGNRIEMIDADGSNRRAIAGMPFGDDSPWGGMLWSPKEDRLWLATIVDEGGNTNGYVVDVRSGEKKRILKRTPIRVTEWRP